MAARRHPLPSDPLAPRRSRDGYIALGANVGDRLGALRQACDRLVSAGLALDARSRVFETVAVTPDPQPDFLNAVVRAATGLTPRALLDACLAIERAMGRVRPPGRSQAARIIDLDVLLLGDLVVSEPGLVVPHPALLLRPFVRIPLVDVARAGLVHPVTGVHLDRADAVAGVRVLSTRL